MTVATAFNTAVHLIGQGQKARVEAACCDMSEAYIGAISSHCPQAKRDRPVWGLWRGLAYSCYAQV